MFGLKRFSLLVAVLLLASAQLFAQGKIAGTVKDASSGEALIGVNIIVEETQQGTVTDIEGDYVLLNLRPGEYTLAFSYIGYERRRVEGVRVTTGQTTRYDVRLAEQAIAGEEVVVQAERPLIQKDLTASKKTVLSEEIDALPVESFQGVLTTQAGVTTGADGAIHIRGGRSNEVAYLVDGLSVGNPFDTNGLATQVATNAIQEMTVVSGAFNAEYGQAMSGIVNIVTKEGGNEFDGSVSLTVGDRLTSNDDIWGIPDEVDVRQTTLEGHLGGPIPIANNLRFFLSGRYDESDGYIFGFREHLPSDSANFNTGYYEIQGRPFTEYEPLGDLPVPGEPVPMDDSEFYSFTGKLSYRPIPQVKLEYSYLQDGFDRRGSGSRFSDFEYRYNPDGLGFRQEVTRNHALHATHSVNQRTFYTVRVSYATTDFEFFRYENPTDPRYTKDVGGTGEGAVVGFPGSNFLFAGEQKGHVYENSRSIRGKADVTRQFGTIHEAKIGVDWNLHSLDRENFIVQFDGNQFREPTVPELSSPSHDKFEDQSVTQLSAYVQDKLEFEDFIINAGVRIERFDADGEYIPPAEGGSSALDPFADRNAREIRTAEADPKARVSPRLGVSFPITNTGIIHFSYGHFYQIPRPRQMFINPEFEFGVGTVPTFGNADLRPEKTVLYEFGLQQQLTSTLAFDVTGFFKDIRDYLALQRIRFSTVPGEDSYRIYQNLDYANVKGITFALVKRRGREGLLSATVDYTFQIAEGNNDNTDAFFFNSLSGREDEFELVPLDFDQRHVMSATVSLGRPASWGWSLIGRFSTGYPYSPQIIDQNIDLLPNSDRKPSQITVDMQVHKNFEIGGVDLQAFAKVFNLFDRLNERFVFDDTGSATRTLNRGNVHASWEGMYGLPGIHELDEWNTRPHFFSPPREVRIGVSLNI